MQRLAAGEGQHKEDLSRWRAVGEAVGTKEREQGASASGRLCRPWREALFCRRVGLQREGRQAQDQGRASQRPSLPFPQPPVACAAEASACFATTLAQICTRPRSISFLV